MQGPPKALGPVREGCALNATGRDDEGDSVAAAPQDVRVERAAPFDQSSRKRGQVITPKGHSGDLQQKRRQPATLPFPQRCEAAAKRAALLSLCAFLAQCSTVPADSAAEPAPPANYGVLVANAVKAFKPFAAYSDYNISAPRWVHAETGWNWLVCLRYEDQGQRRFYTLFIQGDMVVNSRYNILADRCGAQQYVPFDLATGTIKAAAQ